MESTRKPDWVHDHPHARIYRWGSLHWPFAAQVDKEKNITHIDQVIWNALNPHQRQRVLKTREDISID